MSLEFKEKILRLLERDREFRYAVAGLIGLDEILKRLDRHDEKFNEILSRLDGHDRKFNEILAEIRDIRRELREIRSCMERVSLSLEEEAWEVVAGRLRRMGVDVGLTRLILPGLEVNIYGATDDLCIVGEASTRAGARTVRSVDDKLDELRRRYPEHLRGRVLKVVYTMWATEDAVEEAKRRGVWLLKALEDLTPPNL